MMRISQKQDQCPQRHMAKLVPSSIPIDLDLTPPVGPEELTQKGLASKHTAHTSLPSFCGNSLLVSLMNCSVVFFFFFFFPPPQHNTLSNFCPVENQGILCLYGQAVVGERCCESPPKHRVFPHAPPDTHKLGSRLWANLEYPELCIQNGACIEHVWTLEMLQHRKVRL